MWSAFKGLVWGVKDMIRCIEGIEEDAPAAVGDIVVSRWPSEPIHFPRLHTHVHEAFM